MTKKNRDCGPFSSWFSFAFWRASTFAALKLSEEAALAGALTLKVLPQQISEILDALRNVVAEVVQKIFASKIRRGDFEENCCASSS